MRVLIIVSLAAVLIGCGQQDPKTDLASAGSPLSGGEAQAGSAPRTGTERRRPDSVQRSAVAHAPGTAPVKIMATVHGTSSASVSVRFRSAAEDVTVNVYGTDGLRVTGKIDGGLETDMRAGEELALEVPFDTGGAAHSNLVVWVEGTFRGRRGKRIVSFTVGDALPTSGAAALSAVTPGGENLKITPAIEKR